MTDKAQILAYLGVVQRMQRNAKDVELVIDYDPNKCSIYIDMLDLLDKRHSYYIWTEYSYEESLQEMQRLINDYKRYEHDSNNHLTIKH